MCYTRIILNNYEKMTNGGKVKNVRYIIIILFYYNYIQFTTIVNIIFVLIYIMCIEVF